MLMPMHHRLALTAALIGHWFLILDHSLAADPPRIAGITTVFHENSHSDMIIGRLLQGHTLNGQGEFPKLILASLFIDQFPAMDTGRKLSEQHNVPIYTSVREALTLGSDKLAVDGVLLAAEHGNYAD